LHHLRADLVLAEPAFPQRLERAAEDAAALGIGLELALSVTAHQADAELKGLRGWLDAIKPKVACWLVYPSQELYGGGTPVEPVLRAVRQHLCDFSPGTPFAAGTNTDFIFLKRSPPPIPLMDRVCIALNPQVHAFDDLSLVETLEAQPMVVRSARLLANGLPVMVSPITFKPRFNVYAAGQQPAIPPGTLPAQVDPRQCSLFGAGWTLGSLRAMAGGGALSVTYYETTGWRGVMERENGSPWPANYPSMEKVVFPLYHILADLGEFAGGQAVPLFNNGQPEDRSASALAVRLGGRISILAVNHIEETLRISLKGLAGVWRARTLDETNVETAMRSPESYRSEPLSPLISSSLTIPALGYVRIDRQES
jgi:D-apionolactonase